MNLRTHKRRAYAGMVARRAAMHERYPLQLMPPPPDTYPTLSWRVQFWTPRARSGRRPPTLADHFRYRPRAS